MSYAILDIETTGLNPFYHNVWEIGYVLEPEGEEVLFQVRLSAIHLDRADPHALKMNGYHERVDLEGAVSQSAAVDKMQVDFAGRSLIAQPAIFDLTFIRRMFWQEIIAESWSHRAVHDLKTFALGVLSRNPNYNRPYQGNVYDLSGDKLAEIFNVPKPVDQHSALADAIWTRDLAKAMGAIP